VTYDNDDLFNVIQSKGIFGALEDIKWSEIEDQTVMDLWQEVQNLVEAIKEELNVEDDDSLIEDEEC
jgi:hypothetical protein